MQRDPGAYLPAPDQPRRDSMQAPPEWQLIHAMNLELLPEVDDAAPALASDPVALILRLRIVHTHRAGRRGTLRVDAFRVRVAPQKIQSMPVGALNARLQRIVI